MTGMKPSEDGAGGRGTDTVGGVRGPSPGAPPPPVYLLVLCDSFAANRAKQETYT